MKQLHADVQEVMYDFSTDPSILAQEVLKLEQKVLKLTKKLKRYESSCN